ncbi:MAG TPA: chlorite dismutase family protein [Abditibacteriaceae bacterium]|jgi:chlorite dismutase
MDIHVLQHVPFEGPAAIDEWAATHGHSVSITHLYAGESLPALDKFDFLVVMGGPMNVYDDANYSWLATERAFVRQAIDAGKIVLGVCLGAQLIADALGSRVYAGKRKEIGWYQVSLSDEAQDGLFIGYAPRMTVFHWHGDTFDLPAGATHLARSGVTPNQAFLWGDRVLALQFHLEATGESVEALIENGANELVPDQWIQTAEQMLSENRAFNQSHRALYGILDRLAARLGQPREIPSEEPGGELAPPAPAETAAAPKETAPVNSEPMQSKQLEQYPKPDPERDAQRQSRQYITFSFYKLDAAWHFLPEEEKQKGREDWCRVIREFQDSGTVVVPYSCVGIRADHDILLWRIDYKMERLQEMQTALFKTLLGKYLRPSLSFLSMSKRSVYVDKINPEHEEQRMYIAPGRGKFIFVYPFVKSREWYLLHSATRQGIMDEHIQVGVKYPSIKLNTTYSFGLDDQDFVVAFEGDYPEDFLDLVMELRETDGSKYTVRDTPIITGLQGTLEEVAATLG